MKTLMGWLAAVAACTGAALAQETLKMGDSPQIAANRAAREGKLLMVTHLSGHFDDPERT